MNTFVFFNECAFPLLVSIVGSIADLALDTEMVIQI